MAERIHAVEKESGEWVTVEQRNSDYPRRCSSNLDDGQHDEQRAILPSGHSQKPMGNSIIQQTTTDWQKSEAEETIGVNIVERVASHSRGSETNQDDESGEEGSFMGSPTAERTQVVEKEVGEWVMVERTHVAEKESGEWVTAEQPNSEDPRRCSSGLDDGHNDEQRVTLPSGHSHRPMGNSV